MKNFNPPSVETFSEEVQDKLKKLPPVDLYKKLAVMNSNFIPLTDVIGSFYTSESKMAPRLREIVILRSAGNTGSEYEVHQHKMISRSIGMTDQEINLILSEEKVTQLDEVENTLCLVADEFCSGFSLKEKTRDKLYSLLPTESAIELILAIGIYMGLACFIKGTGVQIEIENPMEGRKSPV